MIESTLYMKNYQKNANYDKIQILCLLNKELIEESQKEDAKKEEQKAEGNNKGKEDKKLNILEQ